MTDENNSSSIYPSPDFVEPEVTGRRYEATVPDTLDLVERAAMAIRGLGGGIDPDLDYQHWFRIDYSCNPPYMQHHAADPTTDTILAEAFPLLRLMSGSTEGTDETTGLMRHLLRDTSPEDGLYYNIYRPNRPWHSAYGHEGRPVIKEDFAVTAGQAYLMQAMLLWRALDGDPAWDHRIRKMVDGLTKTAVYRDDYAYYPDGGFAEVCGYPRSGWVHTDEPQSEYDCAEGSITCYYGDLMRVLPRWYQVSGDERALDLAGRLARFTMKPRFWGGNPEPVMVAGNELGHFNHHAFARVLTLHGMLEYAIAANDARVLEFVQRGYEFALTLGLSKLGWVTAPSGGLNEGCTIFSLVRYGIRLSDAGVGDYWDVVDAIVRNHLAEQQLLRADLLEKVVEASPVRKDLNQGECSENVIQRTLGMHGSCATPDGLPKPWIMQCCSGNTPKALYYAWEGAVRQDGGTVTINLLLNRASPWVDVDSYLPYQGKAVVHVKDAERVAIRMASWIPRRRLETRVNGEPREGVRMGNYLVLDGLKPQDEITLDFPIREWTATYTANAHRPGSSRSKTRETKYKCTFRGSTLVDISPRDNDPTTYPFYLRDHMRQDAVPMKSVTRFVPERSILNW